ncbi:hypothetical protein PINS_up008833 [Pythium insidiosum]|nr:hypothetical protein PINS_up008833 [Pythium insidiosum]
MAINGNESSAMALAAPTSPRHDTDTDANTDTDAASVALSPSDEAAEPLQRDDSEETKAEAAPEGSTRDQQLQEEEEDEEGASAQENVCVRVKFLHREDPIALQCAPSIAIADLKQRVRAVYESLEQHSRAPMDAPAAQSERQSQPQSSGSAASVETSRSLRLIYRGKVLKDDTSLASYAFVSEDTIHAVFSRPSTTVVPPPSSTESSDTAAANNATSPSSPTTTPPPTTTTSPPHGVASMTSQDLGNGVFVSRIDIDTDTDAALPDIGRLINTVISSAMSSFGGDGPISTTVHVSGSESVDRPASISQRASTSQPIPSSQQDVRSNPHATPSPRQPSPQQTAATPSPQQTQPTSAAALQNEAASIRRRIPALELTSMARPPNLSPDLYELGNALREASDTYLAIHRQLQFLSSRILNEPNLDRSERARLRTRSNMLVPVLEDVAQMSRSIARSAQSQL